MYESKDKRKEEYVGPYFCFVQSSGMGKTKLLWEYKTHPTDSTGNVDSFLILPKVSLAEATEREREVFDFFLDTSVPEVTDGSEDAALTKEEQDKNRAKKVSALIYKRLDQMLLDLKDSRGKPTYTKIALLFDESQSYSTKNSDTKPFFSDAFESGYGKIVEVVP